MYRRRCVREHGLPVLDPVFNKPMKRTFIPRDLNDIDLFIIDEGYTVPHYMKKDIESRGKPIIVCGDRKQLPPVEDKPAYLVNDDIMMLTQIMRQSAGNFIIELSNMVYDGIEPDVGLYGNVLVIDRDDITPEMIKNSQVIICGTNRLEIIIITTSEERFYIKLLLFLVWENELCVERIIGILK